MKEERNVELDTDLDAEDLKRLVEEYKEVYLEEEKEEFPQEPMKQLELAIEAVFKSWGNPRAAVYRKLNDISDDLGTGVSVQSMVFGNAGNTSGTGVAFTRDPSTGENKLYGEYLINAQGEDVVAGIRTPEDISRMAEELQQDYKEWIETINKLEDHYSNKQDIEFTVQEGKLYIRKTQHAKRTGPA